MTSTLTAPNHLDVQGFQFKLFSRLRIIPDESTISVSDYLNLVDSASKYGLLFVGCPTGFKVLQIDKIVEIQENLGKSRNEVTEFPHREFSLPSQPTHLSVSCDNSFLAVVFKVNGCQVIRIYMVKSFFSQNVQVRHVVRSSNPEVQICGLCWNPGVPNLLALCFSDGSVCVYEFEETNFKINSLPVEAKATGVLIVGSGNSMELGVFGCQSENNWLQWVQEDASRAELPLAKSHQEEPFPIGLTVDTSIQYTLPWGENQKLPPMPLVCIYSHEGLLCLFFAVNLLQLSADSLCSPPQLPSDLSGLSLFTNAVSVPKPIEPVSSENKTPVSVTVAQVAPFKNITFIGEGNGNVQTPSVISGGLQATAFSPNVAQTTWMTQPSPPHLQK